MGLPEYIVNLAESGDFADLMARALRGNSGVMSDITEKWKKIPP